MRDFSICKIGIFLSSNVSVVFELNILKCNLELIYNLNYNNQINVYLVDVEFIFFLVSNLPVTY